MIDRRQFLLGGLSSAIFLPSITAEAATARTLKPVGSLRVIRTSLQSGSAPVQVVSASSVTKRIARVELLPGGNQSRLVTHRVDSSDLPVYTVLPALNGNIVAYFSFADGRKGFITQSTPQKGGSAFSYYLTSSMGAVASGYPITLFTSTKSYYLNFAYPIGDDRFLYQLCFNDFGPASRATTDQFVISRIALQTGATVIGALKLFEYGIGGVFSEIGAFPTANGHVMLGVASHEKLGVRGDIQLAELSAEGRRTRFAPIDGVLGQLSADAVFGRNSLGMKFCVGSAARHEKVAGVVHIHYQMVGAIEQKNGSWAKIALPNAPTTMGITFRACPIDAGRILVVWGSVFDVKDNGTSMIFSLQAAIWNADGTYFCKPTTIAHLTATGIIDDVKGSAKSGFIVAGRLARKGSSDGTWDAFALPLALE